MIDYERYKPTLNQDYFPQILSERFWTSTSRADRPAAAWIVGFYSGDVALSGKDHSYYVRAVRTEQSGPLDPNDIDNDCDG